jgi:hypothetical protein
MADGGGSSKPQTVQTVQNSAPWGPTVKGLTKGVGELDKLFASGGFNIPRYPGETLADTAPETSDAWNMISGIARDPNASSVRAATDYNNAILKGDYTALQPMFDAAGDAVDSRFEAAGRYGGGYHGKGVSEGVAGIIAQAAGNATQAAPGLQQAMFQPAAALGQVGAQRQATAQDQINEAIKAYNYDKTSQIDAINAYMQALSGNWGGTTVGTQPVQGSATSPWMQWAGLGASALGSALGAMS